MIRQIVAYKIQADRADEFAAIKQQMIQESYTLAGLQSSTTAKSLQQENVYIDTMVWESLAAAQASETAFPQLPTAGKFISLMTGPPLFQQLVEYEAETIQGQS